MTVQSTAGLLVAALALLLGSPALAASEPVTLENTEVRTLRSEIVGQDYRLLIAKPFVPPSAASVKHPVIYLLDADMSFPLVRQVVMSLQGGFEVPPVLIVGIGYAGGPREAGIRRNRDYTPTPDPEFMKFAAGWSGGGPGSDESGGASRFLRFIREELKPFIEAEYPADPADNTIFGDSFGGLFAAYALFAEPDTFQRYVLGSPSLWWGNSHVVEMERSYAQNHEDLEAKVFIGAGDHERTEHEEAQFARMPPQMRREMETVRDEIGDRMQMVEVIEPFVETLQGRGYEGLQLELFLFPEETHSSAPPMTLSRGLRVVFSGD